MAGLTKTGYGTASSEKLPETRVRHGRDRSLRKAYSRVIVSFLAFTVAFIYFTTWVAEIVPEWNNDPFESSHTCPQFEAVQTTSREQLELESSIAAELQSSRFLNSSIQRLSGAVKVPTESFDDMGLVGEEPRWDVFAQFHEHLERSFPLVYVHGPRFAILLVKADGPGTRISM